MPNQYTSPPAIERFWSKVKPDSFGCLVWTGTKTPNGYGQIRLNGHRQLVHRFLWETAHGPIPAGLQIDHLCRKRACVKLEHLRLVTNKDNVLCGNGVTAQNARQTCCIHGHPFDLLNTRYRPDGSRSCRICRQKKLDAYIRLKAERHAMKAVIVER